MTDFEFPRRVHDQGGILRALLALAAREPDIRMATDHGGLDGEIAQAFNGIAEKQDELLRANVELHEKIEQLARGSHHKTEFLANLSHELRTPLNSLLILGQLLAQNTTGNLTPKQVEYAQTICVAGKDLLALINDILDMAKVESGTVALSLGRVRLVDLQDQLERAFRQLARDKGLEFRISMDKGLPATIRTDMKRLRQILQNLLANAFKFTEQGAVSLEVSMAGSGRTRRRTDAEEILTFSVTDTGIGIAKDKQRIIFEAFRQSDATTSRQFGGTGLGLTISADLAHLLGGEIQVESCSGKGSTFTLLLPLSHASEDLIATELDDRDSVRPGDHSVLIVADDGKLAARLLDQVRTLGFKGMCAANAHTAVALANEHLPNVAIFGVRPRDARGWASLNLLKRDADTRHIPGIVVCIDDQEQAYACMGALGSVKGPTGEQTLREAVRSLSQFMQRRLATLLVVSAGQAQRKSLVDAVASEERKVSVAATGKQALKVLRTAGIDCAIIDQRLDDMAPLDLVREIVQSGCMEQIAIVLHTPIGPEGGTERGAIQDQAEMLVLTRVKSAEAVFEQTALCLKEAMKDMPPGHFRLPPGSSRAEPPLANKKVLVVDDDMRNVFALTNLLEREGMQVLTATSGPAGVEMLRNNPDVEIVLMDLLMPDQDGYQTIRLVRGMEHFRDIPIIGVSARAMKGDREKCIAAGASDYIAKPVDLEELKSVMRMWLADGPVTTKPKSAQMRTMPL